MTNQYFNYEFKQANSTKEIAMVRDNMALQDLRYPKFQEWKEKAWYQLLDGDKTAYMGLSDGILVAQLIIQPHRELDRVREFKNFRVHPAFRDMYFGKLLEKQGEQGLGIDYDMIICDARAKETGTIRFMKSCGFEEVATLPLYEDSELEVILTKTAQNKSFINQI